ncbi:MAG TPA: hypothetical protein VHZ07_24970 [Bryobacteraceae bacterium]|nr:hypothetical protein [Bryobacteraceae bacterium]
MAAIHAILRALARALQRDLGTLQSIGGNNFFLFAAVLMLEPQSAEFLLLLLGLLLLFPLSTDPLTKIPADRYALWPLTRWQRFALRLASILLSPIIWIAVLMLLLKAHWVQALAFVGFAISIQVLTVLTRNVVHRAPQWNLLLHIPQFPGLLGGLVRNNLRQFLSVLDPYLALLLAAGATAYRLSPHPNSSAFAIMALVVSLTLGTYAQCLFGLEFGSGLIRYRLLPLRGWQILLSKDLAFLIVLTILVLPLNPVAGITSGLAMLAIGHHISVRERLPQKRWRFTGGQLIPAGFLQTLGGSALGFAAYQRGFLYIAIAVVAWAGSLYLYGRAWDAEMESSK